jgi:hypothetical protein
MKQKKKIKKLPNTPPPPHPSKIPEPNGPLFSKIHENEDIFLLIIYHIEQ